MRTLSLIPHSRIAIHVPNPASLFSGTWLLGLPSASAIDVQCPGFHANHRLPYHCLVERNPPQKCSPQSLGECPHRHMDPEKGEKCRDLTVNGDDVVTKAPSESEARDAIAYPNVFWTSCVSFGVALGLFLVGRCRIPMVYRPTMLNTILGRARHGEFAKSIVT